MRTPKVGEKWIYRDNPDAWAIVTEVTEGFVVCEEYYRDSALGQPYTLPITNFSFSYRPEEEPDEMENF